MVIAEIAQSDVRGEIFGEKLMSMAGDVSLQILHQI